MRAAVGYFTTLPAGDPAAPTAAALAWLPLVGVGVGFLAGGAGALAARRTGSAFAGAAVASAANLLATGALHLDGFLDCCDAAFVSADPDRRRAILRDPAHGTFALAGLACVVPLWLAAAAAAGPVLPRTLAFAAGTARAAALLGADRAAGARRTAPGRIFAARWTRAAYAAGTLAAFACGAPRRPAALLLVAAAGGGATVATVAALARRFGGTVPGDVYGAAIVTGETLLLALGAFAQRA